MTAADGTVIGTTQIVDNGPPCALCNLVILSEGYMENQLDQFESDVQQFVEHFQATAPFTELWESLNIYRVDVSSTESGSDRGGFRDTYFDAIHSGLARNGRTIMINGDLLWEVANRAVPEWHYILVLVNEDDILGGVGYPERAIAISNLYQDWKNTVIHELAHVMFGLADEYPYLAFGECGDGQDKTYTGPELSQPNVSNTSDRDAIKWSDLVLDSTEMPTMPNLDCTRCNSRMNPVADGTVGAFEGARYYKCGIFRSEYVCKMNDNGAPFCRVCQRVIREHLEVYESANCYAPIFPPSSLYECMVLRIVLAAALFILVPFFWIPGVMCRIRGISYRIRHCREGNSNECIELG